MLCVRHTLGAVFRPLSVRLFSRISFPHRLPLRPSFLFRRSLSTEATQSDTIFDVTESDFEKMVLQSDKPVVLQASASWCQPCHQLRPVLVKAVQKYEGKVKLARMDIDQCRSLAEMLQIQSVPTVFGLSNGRLLDAFSGTVPESKVIEFVKGLHDNHYGENANNPNADGENSKSAKEYLRLGEAAGQRGDVKAAGECFTKVLSNEEWKESHAEALCGLAICALLEKNKELANELIASVKENHGDKLSLPSVSRVVARVEIASEMDDDDLKDIQTLKKNSMEAPNDVGIGLRLAKALFINGQVPEGIEECLRCVRVDRKYMENSPVRTLLRMLDALSPTDDVVKKARRKLSNYMF
uniref:Thioredoxin 1 n=1 Tax=Stygiella incarcerata TaxID=1712417 RepID=A0A192ZIU2_9EUKA|nr:thioredoxin 1 [Stygiella incarcerata]